MISAAIISAIPNLINLFTSNDKKQATADLAKTVASQAADILGIEDKSPSGVLDAISKDPQLAYKLKELESKHEIAIKQLDLKELELNFTYEQKQNEEITKRWDSDNKSDSRFAKLLRPALTAYLVVVVTVLAIIDGNVGDITIKEHWVTLFTTLCVSAVTAYFGLRTYEKRTGTSKWNTSQNKENR